MQLVFGFYRTIFQNLCAAVKEANENPIDTSRKEIPMVNEPKGGNHKACIPGLTEEIFVGIISTHQHSARSWKEQLEKVTFFCDEKKNLIKKLHVGL